MDTDICRLCRQRERLSASHIIPKFMYKEMKSEAGVPLQYNEINTIADAPKRRGQGGLKEYLLCSKCETKLSKWEGYTRNWIEHGLKKRSLVLNEPKIFHQDGIDYNNLKLCGLSVIWKASISSLEQFKNVVLGNHQDIIRDMLLSEQPGGRTDYGIMISILSDKWAKELITCNRDRFFGHDCYKLIMGGLFWNFIISSHVLPGYIYPFVLGPDGSLLMPEMKSIEIEYVREMAENLNRRGVLP